VKPAARLRRVLSIALSTLTVLALATFGEASPALAAANSTPSPVSSPTSSGSYTETSVASDPTSGSNLFAASNRTDTYSTQRATCPSTVHPVQAYRSSNGGGDWSGNWPSNNNPPPLLNPTDNALDPAPAFDSTGALFYAARPYALATFD
jgi:hypothetical protein